MRAQEHIQQSQFQPLVGVDPLQTTWLERGAVRSRVALLLRSSETQPLFNDLSSIDRTCPQASDQSPGAICSRGCFVCPHQWRRGAQFCINALGAGARHTDSRSPPGAFIRLPVLVLDCQHLHPRPHKAHAIDLFKLFSDLFSIDRTASQASDQSPATGCSRGCTGSPSWCLLLR